MKLPPDDSDDVTPSDRCLTVEVGGPRTINVNDLKTIEVPTCDRSENLTLKVPVRNTHSYLKDDIGSRITLGTLVRARQGGAESAREQSKRDHEPLLKREWRAGFVTGVVTIVTAAGASVGLTWIFAKWGARVVTWAWDNLPWRR